MIVIRYGFKPQVVIMVPPQPLRKMLQSNAGNTLQQRASGGVETRKGETRSLIGDATTETDTEERPRPLRWNGSNRQPQRTKEQNTPGDCLSINHSLLPVLVGADWLRLAMRWRCGARTRIVVGCSPYSTPCLWGFREGLSGTHWHVRGRSHYCPGASCWLPGQASVALTCSVALLASSSIVTQLTWESSRRVDMMTADTCVSNAADRTQ